MDAPSLLNLITVHPVMFPLAWVGLTGMSVNTRRMFPNHPMSERRRSQDDLRRGVHDCSRSLSWQAGRDVTTVL